MKRRGDALYNLWTNIKQKTANPRCKYFKWYGGRGIGMETAWRSSFPLFVQYIESLPKDGPSLDRIDNDKGYVPGNLRWTTMKVQNRNSRANRVITLGDESALVCEWADRTGLSSSLILARIRRLKWSVEKALTTPHLHHGGRRKAIEAFAAEHNVYLDEVFG